MPEARGHAPVEHMALLWATPPPLGHAELAVARLGFIYSWQLRSKGGGGDERVQAGKTRIASATFPERQTIHAKSSKMEPRRGMGEANPVQRGREGWQGGKRGRLGGTAEENPSSRNCIKHHPLGSVLGTRGGRATEKRRRKRSSNSHGRPPQLLANSLRRLPVFLPRLLV